MWIPFAVAATFGVCFLVDKLYSKFFRNQAQHRSGLSVRQNKRYGSVGFVLVLIGIAALVFGNTVNALIIAGSAILIILGAGLILYYMSSGIYYDENGFLVEAFAKKRMNYRYEQILHQQLYLMQGGGVIVELHMTDGKAVQVVSTMPQYEEFLRYAFQKWCKQKGLSPEDCSFHDPQKNLWFPAKEEETCTSQL